MYCQDRAGYSLLGAKDSFITTWREISFCGLDYIRPIFPELFVTKSVVTQNTNRYQMKDMDMIFLQIPINLLYVECLDTIASQSQAFFKSIKNAID